MFSWIKNLFSSKKTEGKEEVVKSDPFPFPTAETSSSLEKAWPAPIKNTEDTATSSKTKKSSKQKKPKVDYSNMNKKQLLEICKEKDIKANASLKKEELIERLQK